MSDRVIVVAGGGRCGTSLVMQMLAAAGVPMLETAVSVSWESTEWSDLCFVDPCHALFAARGYAVKLLPPALFEVVQRLPAERIDWIWCSRDEEQQARSTEKFGRLLSGFSTHWSRYVDSHRHENRVIPALLRSVASYRVLGVRFETLIEKPHFAAQTIADFLGLEGPDVSIDTTAGELNADPEVKEAIAEAGLEDTPVTVRHRPRSGLYRVMADCVEPRSARCYFGLLEVELVKREEARQQETQP